MLMLYENKKSYKEEVKDVLKENKKNEQRINSKVKLLLKLIVGIILIAFYYVLHPYDSSFAKVYSEPSHFTVRDLELEIENVRNYFGDVGLTVSIVKDSKVILNKGFGKVSINGPEVNEKTLFNIGSLTKAFTSFATAKLVSENILDWDTPAHKILPGLKWASDEVTKDTTLIEILSHQTSLPRHDNLPVVQRNLSLEKFLKVLPNLELIPNGFKKFSYNNLMYGLAGEILAKKESKPYKTVIREKVFGPAKILDGQFWDEITSFNDLNFAKPYDIFPNRSVEREISIEGF
ncbi:hypothetical protein HDU92_008600 [Lobulomyces angularis]|nr:hypothetical protein HDU92_008600 [Lobulomyces angularis]